MGADGQFADVHFDRRRDVGRARLDGQGEHLLVDQSVAVMHLECLTDQDDRHVGRNDFVSADDLEIDVGHRLGDRVSLHLTGQGQVGGRTGVEREQLVGSGFPVEGDAQLTARDRHRDRVGPVAVDDAGDLSLSAQPTGGTRPVGASYLGGKGDIGHNESPKSATERCGAGGWAHRRAADQRSRGEILLQLRARARRIAMNPCPTALEAQRGLRRGCRRRRARRPRCPRKPHRWRRR